MGSAATAYFDKRRNYPSSLAGGGRSLSSPAPSSENKNTRPSSFCSTNKQPARSPGFTGQAGTARPLLGLMRLCPA